MNKIQIIQKKIQYSERVVKIGTWAIFVLLGLLMFLIVFGWDYASRTSAKAEARIGQKVSVGKDTFMIVDYSVLNATFTLSNGTKTSFYSVFNK